MAVGGRNRLMHWTGASIPYKPGKNDLLDATRRVAGRDRHVGESWRSRGRGGSGAIESRDPARSARAPPTSPCARRPDRADRDQRDELARFRRSRSGPDRRAPDPRQGRPNREAVAALTERPAARSRRLVADAPAVDAARADRTLGDRALQRMAGRLARGGAPRPGGSGDGRARREPARTRPALAYSGPRPQRREGPWPGPACRPIRRSTGRLADQSDEQIDAWAAELMRDVAKRRGPLRVLADLRRGGATDGCRYRTGVRFGWRAAGRSRA